MATNIITCFLWMPCSSQLGPENLTSSEENKGQVHVHRRATVRWLLKGHQLPQHRGELARLSRGPLCLSRLRLQTPGRKKMQLSFRAHRSVIHKHCSCAQKSLCHSKPYGRSFANCLWALVLVAAVSMPTIHTHSGFHLPLHIHWALPGHSILYLKWQTDFILIL